MNALGAFTYAGGLIITSRDTARLHGLSDLQAWPDGGLLALGDQSDLVEARVVLGRDGRLIGLSGAHIVALKDDQGIDLYAGGQREFDTEGVARLPNGDLLAAFEQHDRILRWPKAGGPPAPAPMPDIAYKHNKGMEGLSPDPAAGPDAYRVGIEATGETFLCRLSSGCAPGLTLDLEGMELSALEVLPEGRLAYLLRSFTPGRGNVIRLRIVEADGTLVDGFELAHPLVSDNFEGVAAVPAPTGGLRFYLVSDDNFGTYNGIPTGQKTLLLAFDWKE